MKPSFINIACALIRLGAPAAAREWAEAMIAEADSLDRPVRRRAWLAECLMAVVRLRSADAATGYFALYLLLAGVMIRIDWGSDAAAPSLALLFASGILLGYLEPAKAWRGGLLAGGTLPLAHALANFHPPLWPFYQYKPLDGLDWLILLSLLVPGTLAAGLGARLRLRAQ
jgi:hypothetical protein